MIDSGTSISKQIIIAGWDDRINERREILVILEFDGPAR